MALQHFAVTRESSVLAEPIATTDITAHSRISTTDDYRLVDTYITAARILAERYTGRSLVQTDWRLTLDRFPSGRGCIQIPRPPLKSITSITYQTDVNDASTTIATTNMVVDIYSEPGRVSMVDGQSWPSVRQILNAVTVLYSAGYTTGQDVPSDIKHGMKMLVGHWYEHRETAMDKVPKEIDFAFKTIMDSNGLGDYY